MAPRGRFPAMFGRKHFPAMGLAGIGSANGLLKIALLGFTMEINYDLMNRAGTGSMSKYMLLHSSILLYSSTGSISKYMDP